MGRIKDHIDRIKNESYDKGYHDAMYFGQTGKIEKLLTPLHEAAKEEGAKDLNDYIAKQITDQGKKYTDWFINNVLRANNFINSSASSK